MDVYDSVKYRAPEVTITPFNTIKGTRFNEISIDKFISLIKEGIDKHCEYIYNDELDVAPIYKTNVYKIEDNNYQVSFIKSYGRYCEYDYYAINTENYQYLEEQLEAFSNITKRHEYERECFEKIENNEQATTEENMAYLNYVKDVREYTTSYILKMLLIIFATPVSMFATVFAILFSPSILLDFALGGLAMFSFCKFMTCIFEGKYSKLFERIKMRRLLKKKYLQVERKFAKSSIKKLDNQVSYNDKNAIYKDHIINYMKSIMSAANKLEDTDRKNILLELKSILDEYTNKCQKLNDIDNRTLTLDGGKKQIIMDTLGKLTTLDMRVADLINRDSKNKVILSDNEKFMKEIDDNLNSINEGKKLTLARER